ncbi:16820_t:CDS:2 [Cetraspora pellucida]|uniref:16820_t:CDS:1 n=1 Tax=Cetraspora pellucida TaxID=1433469 RepID=A0A9N9F524_9GLOM|nr:16820_t:CDS:2 [Cetraspora pellucida]
MDQFHDYQTKLFELLSMNPLIKELEEQAKTIEHLRQRIDQLESSKVTQSILSPISNDQYSINDNDSTDNLQYEVKLLRERVFILETDFLIKNKESQAQKEELELLRKENDEIKQEMSKILEMSFSQKPPLQEFVKPTIKAFDKKESQLNKPISSDTDDEDYIKSTSRPPLNSRRNIVTRDIQIPKTSYYSDQAKNISVPAKNNPLTPTSPSRTERRFENLLPERQNSGFYKNSQYIPGQIHKRSKSETRSSQSQPIQINTPIASKRPQHYSKLTYSNGSPTSSQSGSDLMKSNNNYLSDDSEDHEYVGERNIMESKSNTDQSKEESSTSHDDLCKCNKCVAAQLREIEFYRSKMQANN